MQNWNNIPKKRKPNRKFTGPTDISKILEHTLGRHGIVRQVTSSMIVQRSNIFLIEKLGNHAKDDVKVISYKDDKISVACRHPSAVYEAQSLETELVDYIKKEFPSITISSIYFHLNQEPWQQNWN